MYNKYNTTEINGKFYDRIIIDTCSIMNSHFESWLYSILPNIINSNNRVSVSQATMRELRKISTYDNGNSEKAAYGLTLINKMFSSGFIGFEGNPNSVTETADSYIIQQVMKAKADKQKILVVTQDYQLALDVLMTNRMQSSGFSPAANVQRLSAFGLENFDLSVRPSKCRSKPKLYPMATELISRFTI